MDTDSLISIIVPVYNVSKYLNRCVNSICDQTYSNLEIILIDDGSTDECPKLCDEWALQDHRIRVIHKENGGLSDARNAGLMVAEGDYICFIDADDWVEKDYCAVLLQILEQNQADISEINYRYCVEGKQYESTEPETDAVCMKRQEAMSLLIDNRIPQVVWNKLYKKEIIEAIPFEVGRYHEDEFWTYQVIARINTYVRGQYIGYNYFQRKDSIMGEKYSLKRLDAIEAKVRRQQYLESTGNDCAGQAKKDLLFACLYHGQRAIKELTGEKQAKAFSFLKSVYRDNRLRISQLKEMKLTHKFWLFLGNISLGLICRIRNVLRIGI